MQSFMNESKNTETPETRVIQTSCRLIAASGWSLFGLLFLIPTFYWILVHGFAVVGFFAIVTGQSNAMWPPLEQTINTCRRIADLIKTQINPNFNHHITLENSNKPP
jgi:hypothetical protein